MTTALKQHYSFAEYLAYDDGTGNRYELVEGQLQYMNPPTFRHLLLAKFIEQQLEAEINRVGYYNCLCLRAAGLRTG